MKTARFLKDVRAWLGLLVLLLAAGLPARAEDVDIYSDNPRTTDVPNVLLVLDNGANFSANADACTYVDGTAPSLNGTAGGIEQCAIYNVVSGLPEGAINIGLMVFNSNNIRDWKGANCGASEGGCLAFPLTKMSGTLKTEFLAWVKSWKTSASGPGSYWIKSNGTATGATMQEAWAYYAGKVGLSGRDYAAVQPPAGCQKNFLIYIGNAFNSSGTPGDGGTASPSAALKTAPGVTAAQLENITVPSGYYGTSVFSCGYYSMGNHTDGSGLYTDEWARYMKQTDLYNSFTETQSITTYTIGLLGASCKPDYPALLTSAALYGGGKYYATSDYNEISTAILKILNEVQAVNSVFASASLPVSVNAQGTYLNQIFLGMFRPDSSGAPRWLGNLKQYQFIVEYLDPSKPDPTTATLRLGDSTGTPALSKAGTGFITPTAISFWTHKDTTKAPDSTGGFFSNDVRGAGGGYDAPDGELVEKGGVAQMIRDEVLTVDYNTSPASPRRLYTYCPSGTGCNANLTDVSNQFATTNAAITDGMLQSVAKLNVLSLTRSGTTATVKTNGAHGFANGDSVTISGADQADYNGTKTLIVKTGADTFTFTVAENPPVLAQGSYTAVIPSNPLTLSSLTRNGSTVTVTTTTPHGYLPGQWITVGGTNVPANESRYLSSSTQVTSVLSAYSFTYTVQEGPSPLAGGGTATVSGGGTPVTIDPYSSNANLAGIVRPAPGQTDPLLVQVTTTTKHGFKAGNTVTISGVKDALGNDIPYYNITANVVSVIGPGANSTAFTYRIPYTTPYTPAQTPGNYTVDGATDLTAITSLGRVGNVATAKFISTHKFLNGELVNIGPSAGSTPIGVEGAYTGKFKIFNVNGTNTSFDYLVTTSPATPATGAIQVWKAGVSDRGSLINWLRGENNFGDEPNPGFGYTVRQSVHGDVLHSRPAVVNYGDSRGLVVFYGANDGVFRAVNGSQTTALGGVPPGGELWGLVLPEHYGTLNRQRVNSPELKMPSTVLPSAQPKDYYIDGAPGSYQLLKADGSIDKAYIYLTMRRGGRFMYALDVSSPQSPRVQWRLSSSTPGFAELGQTWSRPRLTLVAGHPNPVLIFGAGYDAGAEDVEPPAAGTMGRGIFVVDAVTGALIWRATSSSDASACPSGASCQAVSGMNWSIPSDVSFVDRDNDGKTDRVYVGDVGGNVWRVDLEASSTAPSAWKVSRLAAVGCNTGACAVGTAPRKFFYPPNVVTVGATDAADAFDVVLLGSGDREHPLTDTANPQSAYNVQNRFYALKDTRTGKDASVNTVGYPITEATLFDATPTSFDTATWTFVQKPYPGTGSGFYVSLMGYDGGDPAAKPPVPPAARKGEKAVNASITVRGTTFFGTNTPVPPSPNSCTSNLGMAKGYALDPFTGAATASVYDGGGMPPSPVSGIVNITKDGKSEQFQFCIGCGGPPGCNSALENCSLSKTVPKKPRRTYWYKR